MIYIISVNTFGKNNVRDIQSNSCWSECALEGYVVIPDEMVDAVLATKGYCDIVLNSDGTELVSFTARAIPPAPPSIADIDMICSDFAEMEEKIDQLYALIKSGTSRSHLFYCGGKFVEVFVWRITEKEGAVYIRSNSDASQRMERVRCNGVWQEWEWSDPPVEEGVEYRTTQRWRNNPVYTKLVNFGSLPNATTKICNHGASANQVIRADGQFSMGMAFPSDGSIGMEVGRQSIRISTNVDYSGMTAYVQIWYTKG